MSFDFSKVVTTGAAGMVGAYIDFGIRTDHHTLDILDSSAVMRFMREHRPSAIIHLAAATDTARCEGDPAYAYSLNGVGTLNVALAAAAVGATFVYVSTSRVFSGDKSGPYTESDEPDGTTVYGKSKRLGEVAASLVSPEHIIVRTSWVFGGGPGRDTKFYGTVLKKLLNKEEVVALCDVEGSPTYGKDLVGAIKDILSGGERGVFHISNGAPATRAAIAELMADYVHCTVPIRAVQRDFFESGHLLPRNEAVSSKRVHLRPWQEALREYLEAEWKEYQNNQAT
ncbi:MAG: NAD(P)-dependent oxidoreductase [Patescibacteria group bacterium]